MQERLKVKAKEEKEKDKTVKLGYEKILVNDTRFWWNERERKLEKEEERRRV